jgi:hypothetical protein
MSKPLYLAPDLLNATAAHLATAGAECLAMGAHLRTAWGRLDTGWRSYARAATDASYHHALQDSLDAARMFEQMNNALRRTVIALQQGDASAMQGFRRSAPAQAGQPPSARNPREAQLPPFERTPPNERGPATSPLPPFERTPPNERGPATSPLPPFERIPPNERGPVAWPMPPFERFPKPPMPPIMRRPKQPSLPPSPLLATSDQAVNDALAALLPPDVPGVDESVTVKLDGEFKLQDLGLPAYLGSSGQLKITRRADGTLELKLLGRAELGLAFDAIVLDGQAGLLGRNELTFGFDPAQQGDVTALALLLLRTGALSGAPIAQHLVDSALPLADPRLNYVDNLQRSDVRGGVAGKIKLSSGTTVDVRAEELIGLRTEHDATGNVLRYPIISGKTTLNGRLDVPGVMMPTLRSEAGYELMEIPGNPARVVLETTFKAAAGGAFSIKGADAGIGVTHLHAQSLVVRTEVNRSATEMLALLRAGQLDLAQLQQSGVCVTIGARLTDGTVQTINGNMPTIGGITGAIEYGGSAPVPGWSNCP